jgi:hypothetical protein
MKLTLGQAAKAAKRSKGTLSKALNSGGISAETDDKGRWQIDPSELSRWMSANPFPNGVENQSETPQETRENSALEVEVKMLREQIERMDTERDRERSQLTGQIEALKEQAERQSADHRRALAALTDQREKAPEPPRRGLWARLVGS